MWSRAAVAAVVVAFVATTTTTTATSEATATRSNISGRSAAGPRSRDPIPYYIVEELPAGTLIGSVSLDAGLERRYDRHQLALLRYGLVGQKVVETSVAVRLFDVDERTGIVRTLVQIDRDRLCPAAVVCVVQLDVLLRPGQ